MEIGDAVRRAQQRDALERAGAELSSEGDEEATSFTPFRRPRCGSRLFVSLLNCSGQATEASRSLSVSDRWL